LATAANFGLSYFPCFSVHLSHSSSLSLTLYAIMSVPEAPQPVQDFEVYNDSADMEKKPYPEEPVDDPFGNEESGEVKYRIMPWW
jgi:hypothetical protein